MKLFETLKNFFYREPNNQEQLVDMLRDAEERNLIDNNELQMMESVLDVSDKQVRDIMVPRAQMTVVDANAYPADVFTTIIQSRHSRFPVIGDNRDQILGILLAKDLLPYTLENKAEHRRIRDLIRPAIFVPESKRLDVLLKEFRLKRNHMAIVLDEYGNVAGLVTIEDVLEQIVGSIEDEYDTDEKDPNIKKINTKEYIIKALTPIDDFNQTFETALSKEDCDTIGGLILQQFGYLPKADEKIVFSGFEVTVLKATRRGVQLLRFVKQF